MTEKLRYREGIALLRSVLSSPDIARDERIEALLLLAMAYVAQGATEAARAAFVELLDSAPEYTLDPLLSPKIRRLFDEAKEVRSRMVRFTDARAWLEDETIVISASLEGLTDRVVRTDLAVRTGTTTEFQIRRAMQYGSRVEYRMPAAVARVVAIDYYFAAYGADGSLVARVGSPEFPLSFVVDRSLIRTRQDDAAATSQESPTLLTRWWFWTAVAVAAAAVVAGSIALQPGTPEPRAGTLPPVRLPLLEDTRPH